MPAEERIVGTAGSIAPSAVEERIVGTAAASCRAPSARRALSRRVRAAVASETIPRPRATSRRLGSVRRRALVQRRNAHVVLARSIPKVGEYRGFPVYRETAGKHDEIWVQVVTGGPLAPYERRGLRAGRCASIRARRDARDRRDGNAVLAGQNAGRIIVTPHAADSGHERRWLSVRRHSRARRRAAASSARSPSSRRPGGERDRSRADAAASAAARGDRRHVFAVDGTPTDCVNVAVAHVFNGLPDLVVSGINKGWNLGDDVTYSGTVAGALEGALLGIPSIGVSLRQTRGDYDFSTRRAPRPMMAEAILRQPLPARTFLNHQCAKGAAEGISCDRAGEAKSRDVGRRAPRSERAAVLLDRRRAERVGAARSVRLSGGARRLRVGDAAASGPDRAPRARRRRSAGVREGARWPK